MRIDWCTIIAVGAAALLFTACDSGSGSGSNGDQDALGVDDSATTSLDGSGSVGQDGTSVPSGDATTIGPGADGSGPSPNTDAGNTPVDPPMNADCDQTGFTAAKEIATIDGDYMIYQAHSAAQPPLDLISVEINSTIAPASGSTVDLTGRANMSLQGADLVIALATGCTAQGCGAWLLADEGSITFTELSATGSIVAKLTNVVFREVNVDQNSGMASVKPGGNTWCIPSWDINMAYEQPAELPSGGPAQATCVAEGTGVYQNDNVSNLQLQNCYGETVSLHDTCGQTKAHWMIGTAGWCTACDQLIASLKQQFNGADGLMSRASIAAAEPGLDIWLILAENTASDEPTLQYCQAYAEQKGVDPAMVVVDFANPAVDVPLIDPPGYALPAQGLGHTWAVMNPYLVADGSGSVQMGFPWSGVLRGTNMEYVWSDYMGGDINQVLGELLQ
jgi:hypothetical protein